MADLQLFLSHSSQDNAWCRPFVAALTAAGCDVWYDEQGLTGGIAWVNTLQREVQTRPIFMPVLTPTAWASQWVQEEIQLAIASHRTILPVMLQPTTVTGFLLTRQWVDAVGKDPAVVAGQVVTLLRTSGVVPVAATPRQITDAPEVLTPWLKQLGFVGRLSDGVKVIVPSVCDVPAGPFLMGTDTDREPRFAGREQPQRRVDLAAFQIARCPVTVAEYYWAIAAQAVPAPDRWATQLNRPEHPVVWATWENALAYAAWLSQMTGDTWRLPTEEEWEKAARGTDGRIYPWGNAWDQTRANTEEGGPKDTTPVGSYPQGISPYGALDMSGNVMEWAGLTPGAPQVRPGALTQSPTNERPVLCGGHFNDDADVARAAHRTRLLAGDRGDDIGFRLVRQLPINQ